jgi:DNA-binding LacI/PurR family transcriptional regulator
MELDTSPGEKSDSGPPTHADSLERRAGYQDALRKAGIPVQIELTREGGLHL